MRGKKGGKVLPSLNPPKSAKPTLAPWGKGIQQAALYSMISAGQGGRKKKKKGEAR